MTAPPEQPPADDAGSGWQPTAAADGLAALGEQLDRLTATVGEHHAVLEVLLDSTEPAAPAGLSRWNPRHPDPDVRRTLDVELIEWVDWLVATYELDSGPRRLAPCWPSHPVAVLELTGLLAAWHGAYASHTASDGPLNWHDRWLWPCLARLDDVAGLRRCHRGHLPRSASRPANTDSESPPAKMSG